MAKIFWIVVIWSVFVIGMYLLVKNENTYRKRIIIIDAIFEYQIDMLRKDCAILVNYTDKEPYDATLLRLWDWGYKRILPPGKFRIIEPYIEK